MNNFVKQTPLWIIVFFLADPGKAPHSATIGIDQWASLTKWASLLKTLAGYHKLFLPSRLLQPRTSPKVRSQEEQGPPATKVRLG